MTKKLTPTGFNAPDRATATEFWVVRHGESTWNVDGRYQGQTDVPLSPVGMLQASTLAERLTGQTFAAVYSSDLLRASQTAHAVAERLAGAPMSDQALGDVAGEQVVLPFVAREPPGVDPGEDAEERLLERLAERRSSAS